ncbi:MAG: sugar porter family MFS transporter [Bacteroidia bacterium]|nr:sugar porter family MFS transporter [Bacteroidia bacterium]
MLRMNRVTRWALTVSLGGFLFGFDTAVISGAEQDIQQLWQLDAATLGLAVAMALYGTVLGALFGGIPADRIGRKATLFWVGVLYFVSAVGSALAPEIISFMFFRFIGGLGVGASSVAAPMYISETAPARKRGWMVGLFQFNIVFGILIAYLSNYLIARYQIGGAHDWRLMLGVVAVPSLAFCILILFVPRSPRWLLIRRNDEAEARRVLEMIDPETVESEIAAIKASHQPVRVDLAHFFSARFRFPILLAFLFAFFNQVSGINAIIYYTKRIFELTGQGATAALASSVGVGLVNLVFTMLGLLLIDRFGRRTLMFAGSAGLIATLGLIALAFFQAPPLDAAPDQLQAALGHVPLLLFAYIACFALSQGAVIWVFISEIFPNEVRAWGQSFGSFTHWIFAALIANTFPLALNQFGPGTIFLFFTAMMALQLVYVWRMMPETKGQSLEQLEAQLTRKP